VQEELLDIYDEFMRPRGVKSRSRVHADGDWHRTFHCWIWMKREGRTCLLFQKRSTDKDVHPDLLDITAAGHLLAGESVREGARELEEELGIRVPFEKLIPAGTVQDASTCGERIDNEFCHLFFYESRIPLRDYRLQREEVAALLMIEWEQAKAVLRGTIPSAPACGIAADGRKLEFAAVRDDFVRHEPAYYEYVFAAGERCIGLR
jgi:isopentenyldiphosphate isomerase